jgi:glyoxylase-like metal-dependent hydrolase (beta-lactamase superfamily II)
LDWVVASCKNLTAIYVTHGHGDHFFGLALLLERFPKARAGATPATVEAMNQQLSPASIENFTRLVHGIHLFFACVLAVGESEPKWLTGQ